MSSVPRFSWGHLWIPQAWYNEARGDLLSWWPLLVHHLRSWSIYCQLPWASSTCLHRAKLVPRVSIYLSCSVFILIRNIGVLQTQTTWTSLERDQGSTHTSTYISSRPILTSKCYETSIEYNNMSFINKPSVCRSNIYCLCLVFQAFHCKFSSYWYPPASHSWPSLPNHQGNFQRPPCKLGRGVFGPCP